MKVAEEEKDKLDMYVNFSIDKMELDSVEDIPWSMQKCLLRSELFSAKVIEYIKRWD